MSLRTKLVTMVAGLLTLSVALFSYGLVVSETRFLKAQNEEKVQVIVNSVDKAARDAVLQNDLLLLVSYLKFMRGQYPPLLYCKVAWGGEGRAREVTVGSFVLHRRAVERRVRVQDPRNPALEVTVQAGIDMDLLQEQLDETVARLRRELLLIFGAILLVAVLLSSFFAFRITKPLEGLVAASKELGKGKLGVKLEQTSQDEVGELVSAFNLMSARLEALDEMKKDFVSSVTHELRSPLGAIESFMDLLRDRLKAGDGGRVQEYIQRVQANIRRLSGFINNLLDVAKIERGKMDCVLRPMDFRELAQDVCEFFTPRARELGVELAADLPAALPSVQGDYERLRQVLVNLVSNALKFSGQGGRVRISAKPAAGGAIEVAVADTGRGMAPRDLEKLFQKFQQGKNVSDGVIGPKGTGLGLFIVKSILEQHGTKVEVRSEVGRGTEFRFALHPSAGKKEAMEEVRRKHGS